MPAPLPRILFVDDETKILTGLRRALKNMREQWSMTFISSPMEALAAHRAQAFDVVVSDVSMPGMNGLDMILQMREGAPETIYIFLTGTADVQMAASAINKANIFRFFTKPCATDLLAEGIAEGLNQRQRRGTTATKTKGEKLEPGSLSAALGLAAINRIQLGVIVVDRKARVLFTNRSGGGVLSEKDGLFLDGDNICRAADSFDSQRLHEIVKGVCDETVDEDANSVIAISRPSLKRPLTALVIPLQVSHQDSPLVGIFVADHDNMNIPAPEAIARLFDLTPTESRLVHSLAKGTDLEEAAKNCGLTISTARTYLKQCFSKTNTNKQSELVKLILTTPSVS